MSTLIMSNAFITDASNGAANQCLTGTCPQNLIGANPTPLIGGTECLVLYQGQIPSTSDQNTFTYTSRMTDALLQFTGTGAFSSSGVTIVLNFGTTKFGTILKSGTIGWFSIGNTDSSTNRPQLFGTVGAQGSTADLILPKVSVVSNDLWICSNLWFNLNTILSYSPQS